MYGFKEKRYYINMYDILSLVTQEEIIEMALGFKPIEHEYIESPFRTDDSPGCYFEWYDGWFWFVDWTTGSKHKDCFNIVQHKLGLTFHESLKLINKHFNLKLESSFEKIETKELEKVDTPRVIKIPKEISFKSRFFNNTTDKEFWSDFGISKKDLIEDNVFPIIWYKIYSKKLKTHVTIRPNTRSYAITGFEGRVKIYTPDVSGRGKWATSCNVNDIGGIKTLRSTDTLVISKSYKDYRVLKNEGLNVIWLQNEGMIPEDEVLIPIVSEYQRVVVFFDNDEAGINASEKLVEHLKSLVDCEITSISLSEDLLDIGITDPSDLYKNKGREHLLSFLKEQKLL